MTKQKSSVSLLVIILVVVGVLGLVFFFGDKDDASVAVVSTQTNSVASETMVGDDMMMDEKLDEKTQMVLADAETVAGGVYEEFSPSHITRAEEGDVVLFFHATWCPSCRALDKAIESERENIPSDLSILKLDYDNSSDLKKKYGVTTQHTLVQIDKDGNLIKRWSGTPSLSALVEQVQ